MSGNETSGIHNFFEVNSSHQPQVEGADSSHITSNNSPWIDTHAVNRVTSSSDFNQGNVRLPFQTPFGIGSSQIGLKQHLDRIQSKDHQLDSNKLMHVSNASQGRSGQVKFQQDSSFSSNLSLMQRGLANFGSQGGNSPVYGSGFSGSLEKPEVEVSQVGFDFLGGHQHLNSQYSGMSQHHQRQQQGSNDMQWKQHLIALQMQEIQRQQQLQQLHLGARQHSSFNQMYGTAGQAVVDELPGMLSGMPIANAVNFMPGELMGSQSKPSNNSQMFIAGNMNWAHRNIPLMHGIPNGFMFSQDQGQFMQSMGYVPRQFDQSLHGIPVSGGMGPLNHYFQLQGMPNDSSSPDLMSKLGENHAERTAVQSSAFSDFQNDQRAIPNPNEGYSGASFVAGRQTAQGKILFGNALVQGDTAVSGGVHQSNHFQVQEFQDGQEQTDLLGKSHENITTQIGPSHTVASLDPTEEKILFGVDDNASWDASLGISSNRAAGAYLNGYPMQNNDSLSTFPSIQSGTWSALVQEALEVSSSDTGQQEEWSGLSLQKAEPHTGRHLVFQSDNGKQNSVRDAGNSLHNACSPSSKSFPLFCDTTASQSCHSMPNSQQHVKFSYGQNERLEMDHSVQTVQQLSKETNDAQFSQGYQPYNFIENSLQEKPLQLNAPNGVWVDQEHQQSMHSLDSTEMAANSQGMQNSQNHLQRMPFYSMNNLLSTKQSGWGIESPSSSGSRNFKSDENGDLNQYSRSNDINTTMHIELMHTRSLGKASECKDAASLTSLGIPETVKSETSNQKIPGDPNYAATFADFMSPNSFRSSMVTTNQLVLNKQASDSFKRFAGHLFVKDKDAGQVNVEKPVSNCTQDWDTSLSYTNKESSETHSHVLNNLNAGSLLAQNDHMHFMSEDQKYSDQSDQKSLGSQRFQFHPMGNLELSVEQTNQERHKSHSQGPAHPPLWGLKNQEKENIGNSQWVGHMASTTSDMEKDCYADSTKKLDLAEIPHTDTISGNNSAISSFSATIANYSHEKRTGISSQNVHMLFGKPDHLDDCNNAVAKQNISENNSSSCVPERVALDGPISHLEHSQGNPLQGSGLHLAHPSQRQPALGNSLVMHTPAEGGSLPSWVSSTTSTAALPTIHEVNQRENSDYKTVMPSQACQNALYSTSKGNTLGMIQNARSQGVGQQQQLQQQSISCASRPREFDQSVDEHSKHHPLQVLNPQDRYLAIPTSQAFLSMSVKVPSSRLASCDGSNAPAPSQHYSHDRGNSDMMNAIPNGGANQLLQAMETVSANHPSASSVVSQQGHYLNIFDNAWRNAATQQLCGLPKKFASNLLQSLNPLQSSHQDDRPALKGENASSVLGTYSANSQHLTYGEENPLKGTKSEQNHAMNVDVLPRIASASEVQEKESKSLSNKSSAVFISSSAHMHQQDNNKGEHADNQRENPTFSIASSSSNDAQKHSYSLLQQMQAMKGTDSDRLKGVNSVCRGSDTNSQARDVKMLSFSFREVEDSSVNELQNSTLSGSVLNHIGTNECLQINPQLAPPWFEQYGNYKDNQALGISDSLGICHQSSKANSQHFLPGIARGQMDNDAMMKRRADNISESPSVTGVAADCHPSPHSKAMFIDESLVPVRKKWKVSTPDLLSWHKEVTQSSRSFQSFSLAKMEWAQATNRLIEKIDDDNETMGDVSLITRPRRRLILTTRLIQQLFSPVPAKYLFEDSMLSYENVIYYLTKLAFGEVCSMISFMESDSELQSENSSITSEKSKTLVRKRTREEFFSNIVENFAAKFKKLQSNFFKMEGGSSVVDYRMECQDVERGSIINRFARFHGRGPADGAADGLSTSEGVPRRAFPQRSVTVVPMPRNLPDGAMCLSL